MLIETHAHLDYPDFANDLEDVLRRANDAGVTRIVTIGTSSKAAGALSIWQRNIQASSRQSVFIRRLVKTRTTT